jgi:hypothetical protein
VKKRENDVTFPLRKKEKSINLIFIKLTNSHHNFLNFHFINTVSKSLKECSKATATARTKEGGKRASNGIH